MLLLSEIKQQALSHNTAHYGFSLTSCGSSEKLAPTIQRGRISKPRQESAPHKVRENHNIVREADKGFKQEIGRGRYGS